jgi:hypothetical protein
VIEAELLRVFEEVFYFDMESFLIPTRSVRGSAIAIRNKLQAFTEKYGSPQNLLIVVYEGHAMAQLHPGNHLKFCKLLSDSPLLL